MIIAAWIFLTQLDFSRVPQVNELGIPEKLGNPEYCHWLKKDDGFNAVLLGYKVN